MTRIYTTIAEKLDSVIANEIDRLESSRDSEEAYITDDEYEKLNDFIDALEAIRGVINE